MPITMHSASVPIFVKMLGNVSVWLDSAEAFTGAGRPPHESLPIGARSVTVFIEQTQADV